MVVTSVLDFRQNEHATVTRFCLVSDNFVPQSLSSLTLQCQGNLDEQLARFRDVPLGFSSNGRQLIVVDWVLHCCITIRHTASVSDTQKYAVSIRLDAEVQPNLNLLEASGLSRSEAIRKGLKVAANQLRRNETVFAEAHMVANDQ